MAFARVYRARKFSGMEFHTLRISQSGFLLAMPVERSRFLSWKIFIIMINRQKHYTKYLHDKLETKDIRCI